MHVHEVLVQQQRTYNDADNVNNHNENHASDSTSLFIYRAVEELDEVTVETKTFIGRVISHTARVI